MAEDGPMPQDPQVSVAPLPPGMHDCPGCHRRSAYHDPRTGTNRCQWVDCSYYERVTSDHIPRMFTEAEVRQIAHEEAIKVSRDFSNGQPVLSGQTLGGSGLPQYGGSHLDIGD